MTRFSQKPVTQGRQMELPSSPLNVRPQNGWY